MMNVEHKQSAASPGSSVNGAHGRHKAAAASAAGTPADGGGFMSLLASLGSDEGLDLTETVLADAGVDAGNVADPAAALPAVEPGTLLSAAWATPLPPEGETVLPAETGATTLPSPFASAAPDVPVVPPLWASPAQMLQGRQMGGSMPVAETAAPALEGIKLAGMEGVRGGLDAVLPVPAQAAAPRAATPSEHGLKIGQDEALRELPGPLGRAVSEQMQEQAQAHAPVRHAALKSAAEAAGAALSRGMAEARSRMDGVAEGRRSDAVSLATEQVLTSVAAMPVTAERRSDKATDPGARIGGEGGWNRPTLMQNNGAEVTAAAAGASVGDPGLQVAEQVSYWIANDVQNAELTLDQFGDSPVEVSISLSGKEARVEFRSDMQEMRQVLQGAVVQLKEMLQSQGLVLAGVSVGNSGADTPGQREEQAPRQNPRQASVTVPQVAALGGGARVGQASGRALDVFV